MKLRGVHSLLLLWRKIKRFVEWISYGLFDAAVLRNHPALPNASVIVVVQLKLLGDFILWIPYAKAYLRHAQIAQKEIVIVVNAAVLQLAELVFQNCILIGVDRTGFIRRSIQRKDLLLQLRSIHAGITYLDTQPRDALIEDSIVRALGAPAWGFDSTFPDRPWIDRMVSRRLYSRLLPHMSTVHQGLRHQALLRAIGIEEYLEPVSLSLFGPRNKQDAAYFVIVPGASKPGKRWPTSSFTEVALRVLTSFPDMQLLVLGNAAERQIGDEIVRTIGRAAKNLAGETDLLNFVASIAHAQFVLGNDSAACHIAAACGIPSFPVVGGGHPGWFFPYPATSMVARTPITIMQPMSCFGCDWNCRFVLDKNETFPCIARITPDRVWQTMSMTLSPIGAPAAHYDPSLTQDSRSQL